MDHGMELLDMEKKYDLFCSYSHVDNDSGWVISLIDNLSSVYQKLTGEPLKIFLDEESIITSEIWEKKIKSAIKDSKLFVAILSPSYFKSKWCVKEWELISSIEKQLRIKDKLPEEFGLIVPILLHPLDRGKFSNSEKLFGRGQYIVPHFMWQRKGQYIVPSFDTQSGKRIFCDALWILTNKKESTL